jgi:MFS family permease
MATLARPAVPVVSLVLLVAAAILLNYVDRGTIAVAAPLMKGELGLSAYGFGIAVSAFFWVYAPIQLGIGWLVDRFSVYRLLAAGLLVWALSTAAMGFVGSLTGLVALRLLLGLGESIAFPGASKIICRHVPPERRGIANSAVAAALALGPAVGTLAGGMLMIHYGWRAMFMVCGLATLIWFLPWLGLMQKLPAEHRHAPPERFPLKRLIGTRALLSTSLSHFAANYSLYFLISWLPLYLVTQRGFTLEAMTVTTTTAFLAQAASAISIGLLCDHHTAGGGDQGRAYRIVSILGNGLICVAILGIALADDTRLMFAFMVLAGIGCGPCSVTLYATAQNFAGPRAAGTYVGVQNAVGNCAGIIAPVVTGLIIDRTGSYLNAFYVAAAVCGFGVLCWALLVPKIAPLDLD